MKEDVLILGAGVAGLSAGLSLVRRGAKVVIVEKENGVGGMCRTFRKDGFIFDLGGHRFITKDMAVLNFVREIMGGALHERPRRSRIFLKGRYFQYPLNAGDILKGLPTLTLLKAGADYLLESSMGKVLPGNDSTFERWVRARFGKTLYEIYFKPYSEKLWGIPCNEISAVFASQRISLLNLLDVVKRLFFKGGEEPRTYAKRFLYPEGGIGSIPERMAEEIDRCGGTILLDSIPSEVEIRGGRVQQVKVLSGCSKGTGGVENVFSPSHLISTIPVTELIPLLPVEERIRRATKMLRFRSLIFLNLMLKRDRVSENTWLYIPEEDFLIFRIQEPKNWHENNAPRGMTSLILEIACNYEDDIWNRSKEDILERGLQDLKRLGFDLSRDLLSFFITRLRYAYPIYFIGFERIIDEILKELGRFENLLTCGRQGLYRYNNMDHSIAMGISSADWVTQGLPPEEVFKIASRTESFE